MAGERDAPGVIAPPPLVYLGALGVGLVLDWLLPSASIPAALRWPLGAALILGGAMLMLTFVGAFRRARTHVDPYRPTTAIVTSGPYRFTRNPGYLGMAFIGAGIAVLAEALWVFLPLALAVLVIDRGVIAREERYLERKFGEEYLAYRRSVRRWI